MQSYPHGAAAALETTAKRMGLIPYVSGPSAPSPQSAPTRERISSPSILRLWGRLGGTCISLHNSSVYARLVANDLQISVHPVATTNGDKRPIPRHALDVISIIRLALDPCFTRRQHEFQIQRDRRIELKSVDVVHVGTTLPRQEQCRGNAIFHNGLHAQRVIDIHAMSPQLHEASRHQGSGRHRRNARSPRDTGFRTAVHERPNHPLTLETPPRKDLGTRLALPYAMRK